MHIILIFYVNHKSYLSLTPKGQEVIKLNIQTTMTTTKPSIPITWGRPWRM